MDFDGKTVLVTGAAGFIGFSLIKRLLENDIPNATILGCDNCNSYYDVHLKEARLKLLNEVVAKHNSSKYRFFQTDISEKNNLKSIFAEYRPNIVVNLAAQAGVRYSIENPDVYISSNILGFYNVLECCREFGVEHLVYASSSSVYGSNKKYPYSTSDRTDNPVSLYAATKKADEVLAHSYAKLYEIPTTGLRFFTVYGPYGRPDMAYFSFSEKLRRNEKIRLFNFGNCSRDFTYIDDISEGIIRVMKKAPVKSLGDDGLPVPPYAIYNIGNGHPESLREFVTILSEELIRAGVLSKDFNLSDFVDFVPMQPGDVQTTFADMSEFKTVFGFSPKTNLRDGLAKFCTWYAIWLKN